MKILITGANGQLAWDLKRLANPPFYTVLAPNRVDLDITDPKAIASIIDDFKPDVVINTAAFTQVDQAESESTLSYRVNGDGAKFLAIACAKTGCMLLHLSTDYVFDGKQTRPYQETDVVAPLNVYGDSKWRGEEAVRQHCERHLILRVSSVFGVQGNNFVKTILRLATTRESLRVVADQTMCPTPAAAIAETLLLLAQRLTEQAQWGTYHYCGAEPTNWFQFANAILTHARRHHWLLKTQEISAISTAEYPTAAQRPLYSVLNCDKLKQTFGITCPPWQSGLYDVIDTLSSA